MPFKPKDIIGHFYTLEIKPDGKISVSHQLEDEF